MTADTPVTGLPAGSPLLHLWQGVVTGILNGDPAGIEKHFSEDATFYDAYLGTVQGAATIADKLGRMKGRAFASATAEVRHALADDSTCAIEWSQHLDTSDGPLTVEVATFCSVTNGRITRLCDYVQPIENRKP